MPESFAPSRWEQLEACPLSVWSQNLGALPEGIEILVGRILHDVRAQFVARGAEGNAPTLSSLLHDTTAEYEQRLCIDPSTACLTPIADAFGRRRWFDAEARLRIWSATLASQRPRKREEAHNEGGPFATHGPTISFGVERPWNAPALRLRGRPDEASVAADGAIEIVDYKSGRVIDREGVQSSIATQLQLYALMAEHLTGRSVRLFVQGRGRIPIEWDESDRARIAERVSLMSAKYWPKAVQSAEEVSRPGPHCVGCRLRPQCPRYLREVSAWWPNTGHNPRPLPLDAWGRVRECGRDPLGNVVHLDDPAGRRVVISGIDVRHGLETVRLDEELYAFGLAAGEDQFMHGRALHPRAFHEHSPSARWASSPCPMFFVGPRAAIGKDSEIAGRPVAIDD